MNRPAADKRDRPRFPEYEEEFGEDPSRFLYCGVDPRPRIRGIQSVGLARAWLDVEVKRPGGPRQEVIAAINKRIAELADDEKQIASPDAGAGEARA